MDGLLLPSMWKRQHQKLRPEDKKVSTILQRFENDMTDMITNIKFTLIRSRTKKTRNYTKRIQNSNNIFIFADKITNIYTISLTKYKNDKRRHNTTTKKSTRKHEKHLNKDDKEIAKQLEINQKVNSLPEQQSFIPIKDH